MKRATWLESVTNAIGSNQALTAEDRQDLSNLDTVLFDAWNLGDNIILVWTQDGPDLRFLVVRHYTILEPFGDTSSDFDANTGRELINRILAGPKFIPPSNFNRICASLGGAARVVQTRVRQGSGLSHEIISSLITRYGVSLVRERAVLLLDIVDFSLRSPLEQVAMLNSLSYSVNSACRQLVSEGIQIDFARFSTGDGFYMWNRARDADASIALYKLMMLILADNAVAMRKAARFPVPRLRAAFHVGEHYEFFQVEALNPTAFSYIVGQVTIELSRIIEKALPGQILLGEFNISVTDAKTGRAISYNTSDFIERTAASLGQLKGMAVSQDHIEEIRCYLTGQSAAGGGFEIGRYSISDKHGMTRMVYNAKINMHLNKGEPIFLGIQEKDLRSGALGRRWP